MSEKIRAIEQAVRDEEIKISTQSWTSWSEMFSHIWKKFQRHNNESLKNMELQEYFYLLVMNLTGTSLKEEVTQMFSESFKEKVMQNRELATHYLIKTLKSTTSSLNLEIIDDIEKSANYIHKKFNSPEADIIVQWMNLMDDQFLRYIALNEKYDNNTRLIATYLIKDSKQVEEIIEELNKKLKWIQLPKNPNEQAWYEYNVRVQKQRIDMAHLRLKKPNIEIAKIQ